VRVEVDVKVKVDEDVEVNVVVRVEVDVEVKVEVDVKVINEVNVVVNGQRVQSTPPQSSPSSSEFIRPSAHVCSGIGTM